MTNDGFFGSLSEAEWNEAEAIEAEITNLMEQGLTKDVALQFVRAVLNVRKAVPEATIAGIFDTALSAGLLYVTDAVGIDRTRAKSTNTRRSGKRGSTLR